MNKNTNNNIVVFTNEVFGQVRAVEIDGEPWLVGKDVAQALGYSDTNKAIAMHVDKEDKLNDKTSSSLGQRGGWLINESGLYSLILSSKLPTAKQYKRWVTSEVLPAIRKTGGYIPTKGMSDSEIMAHALLIAQKTIDEKDAQIERQAQKIEADKPKVEFYDAIGESTATITVDKFAKLLFDKCGLRMGRNKML